MHADQAVGHGDCESLLGTGHDRQAELAEADGKETMMIVKHFSASSQILRNDKIVSSREVCLLT